MNGVTTVLSLLVPALVSVLWYLIGRQHGRERERARFVASPAGRYAEKVSDLLGDPQVVGVNVRFVRTSPGEWDVRPPQYVKDYSRDGVDEVDRLEDGYTSV